MSYLAARLKAFGHALAGLKHVVAHEPHAKLHLLAALLVVLAGLWVGLAAGEWLWIALAVALVWITEVFNSAIEYLCDVVSPDHAEAVKRAKDIAAGGVLLAAVFAVLVGAAVFLPHLLRHL